MSLILRDVAESEGFAIGMMVTEMMEMMEMTHVVLLLHVHLPRGSADVELLFLGHLADLAIIALVSDGGGGR